jgi:DNA polymerase III alpha subunit
MPPRFHPLHVHSYFSLLEGVDGLDALLARAKACGYPALALTDTNNLYGAVPFVEAARAHGIRPILGACLRWEGFRATALIAEPEGYASLCRILSRMHLTDSGGSGGLRPDSGGLRPPLGILAANAVGLHLLVEDPATVTPALRDAFGPRLWFELIRPAANVKQERERLEAAERLGLKPVASVAAHFATPAGHDLFRLLTAIRLGTPFDRVPEALPITPAHHLPEGEAIHRRFADLPEAIIHTELLAQQCRSDVLPRGVTLPPAKVPRAHSAAGYLKLLCERGLARRELADPAAARDRLMQELHIINQRDLAGYFLVVRDIARMARRRGYPMALRGSAGNSLACYLLHITDVDPLRFDLPLERFLHAGRPDLPDIDLDFDWKIRDEIIAAVMQRYGPAHTAMICTHLFLQPRSAFREAGKVHGLSNAQIADLLDTLADRVEGMLLPEGRGEGGLRAAVPRSFPLEPERWPRILADARRLLGRPHHLSIHPGGIVITPEPIENYVPLQLAAKIHPSPPTPLPRRRGRGEEDTPPSLLGKGAGGLGHRVVITQFEKDAIEQVGLVKIDLLGNRALSTVAEVRRWAALSPPSLLGKGVGGLGPDPSPLAPVPRRRGRGEEAGPTLALLQRGDTIGVNQLESPAMRHLLIQMRPRGLNDVIQSLALIRPGAASVGAKERFIRRRRGLEPVTVAAPCLEPLLRDTCGLMVYEDDALRVVQALMDVSPPEADRIRKQITKAQSAAELEALSRSFLTACQSNGIARAAAEEMWIQLAKFNSYSFCKSHAVSYGLIAWEAAWWKANQPLPFWVGALNNNEGMYPRRVYVEAAKRMGIRFALPCVNRSERVFTLERPNPPAPFPKREGGVASTLSREGGTSFSPLPPSSGGEGSGVRGVMGPNPSAPFPKREGGAFIRTGLGAIRGLDEQLMDALIEERGRRGPFAGVADFARRIPAGPEALGLLIAVGAFDFTGQSRPALALEAEVVRAECGVRSSGCGVREDPSHSTHRTPHSGLSAPDLFTSHFALRTPHSALDSWTPSDLSATERWKEEWQRLGFLVGPPLMCLFRPLLPQGFLPSSAIRSMVGQHVRMGGLVATARHTPTKHGEEMQFITLEDEDGLFEVTLFPGNCKPVAYLSMGPYIVEGIVEEQYDVVTVTATGLRRVEM